MGLAIISVRGCGQPINRTKGAAIENSYLTLKTNCNPKADKMLLLMDATAPVISVVSRQAHGFELQNGARPALIEALSRTPGWLGQVSPGVEIGNGGRH